MDFILPAVALLKALNVTPGNSTADHSTVTSAKDLQDVVLYSMVTCSGVERTVTDKELFDLIVKLSVDIPHEVSMQLDGLSAWFDIFVHSIFEIQENIGGNAALMAEKMVQLAPNNSQVAWLSAAILLSFIFSTWWCLTRRFS